MSKINLFLHHRRLPSYTPAGRDRGPPQPSSCRATKAAAAPASSPEQRPCPQPADPPRVKEPRARDDMLSLRRPDRPSSPSTSPGSALTFPAAEGWGCPGERGTLPRVLCLPAAHRGLPIQQGCHLQPRPPETGLGCSQVLTKTEERSIVVGEENQPARNSSSWLLNWGWGERKSELQEFQ